MIGILVILSWQLMVVIFMLYGMKVEMEVEKYFIGIVMIMDLRGRRNNY